MRREGEPAEQVGLNLIQNCIVLAVSDGQVGHNLGELAPIGRGLGPTVGDHLSEPPQLRVWLRCEIQHLWKTPTAGKPQVKGVKTAEHVSESRADVCIYSALVEEREEHGDMRWHSCLG